MGSETTSEAARVRETLRPEEAAEELRLWADYYDAMERAMELVRAGAAPAATLLQVMAEDAKATAAIKRIKEIRGIRD